MRKSLMKVAAAMTLTALFHAPVAAAGTLTTSGVTYNPDSSATISRPSDRAQVPENLIDPTQGWVAVRMKMGFPSTTTLSPDPVIWDMSESDPRDLFLYYDVASRTFHLARNSKVTGGGTLATPLQFFNSGSVKTVIAAWTQTSLKISIDGGPFVSKAVSTAPSQAALFIGSTLVQGSGRQPNSDYYWVAAGTGTLSDTDAATIHSFGNVDHPRSDFPGSATFVWWAESDAYNTDSGGPTASPTPTLGPTATRTPSPTLRASPTPGPCSSTLSTQGDANCDCTVSGVDYAIWLGHYRQSTGNGFRDGDFNGDGTVSGVDYAIWLTNYRQTCSGPTPTTSSPTRTPTPIV